MTHLGLWMPGHLNSYPYWVGKGGQFQQRQTFPTPPQIFTNKCERSGCRQREMMKLTCERCGRNFCIKHRHPLDHDCSGKGHPTSLAG